MHDINNILFGLILPIVLAVIGIFITKDSIKQIIINSINKKVHRYYSIISSEDYLLWQNIILNRYYNGYFTEILNYNFPVHIYYSNICFYPFDNLFSKDKLVESRIIDINKINYYKKYKNLQEHNMLKKEDRKVKYPKRKCFMLNEIILDKNYICGFTAYVGRYEDNVYSSFILDYENFLLYKKYKKNKITDKLFNVIKKKMIIRNNIHNGMSIDDVLLSGCKRASMFGVQVAIIAKDGNDNDKYKIIVGKRSHNVATRPGFYQFIPAGAFEIYGDEINFDDIKIVNQCSIELTIFREYLEELFDREDAEKQNEGETLYKLLLDDEIIEIKKMITEEKTIYLEFLGSVVSLVDLRHLLSFVIRIDDKKYSEKIFKNIKVNHRKELSSVEPMKFSDFLNIDKMKLHPSSAALYKMLLTSSLYKDIENFGIN